MMREHKLLEPKALLLYLFLPFSTIYATAPPFTRIVYQQLSVSCSVALRTEGSCWVVFRLELEMRPSGGNGLSVSFLGVALETPRP
jgi:hypothetical protein